MRRDIPFARSFLGLGLAGLVISALSTAQARVFDPESFMLDNGLQVVVITNRRAPIVTHMVWYKVGAADEAAGESGNAHFLEHLMFKGTKTLAPGEFSRIIAKNGGRENAFTGHDFTGYHQTVARDRLEIVMKYEADRMANLVLTDEVVLPERDVILEERRSRVDNDPGSKLQEMVRATLFLNHPYRIPVIGWEHEINELSTETALGFYKRWYAPNNAILVVAGDVTAAEVRPLAEKYYGKVAKRPFRCGAGSPNPRSTPPDGLLWKAPRCANPRSRSPTWRQATTARVASMPMPCRFWMRSWAAARPADSIAPWSSIRPWPPRPEAGTAPRLSIGAVSRSMGRRDLGSR